LFDILAAIMVFFFLKWCSKAVWCRFSIALIALYYIYYLTDDIPNRYAYLPEYMMSMRWKERTDCMRCLPIQWCVKVSHKRTG